MEELRIILSNKLHQFNLKQEHLMGELEKIKELSNTIVTILIQIQNRDEPEGSEDINLKREDWDNELTVKDTI